MPIEHSAEYGRAAAPKEYVVGLLGRCRRVPSRLLRAKGRMGQHHALPGLNVVPEMQMMTARSSGLATAVEPWACLPSDLTMASGVLLVRDHGVEPIDGLFREFGESLSEHEQRRRGPPNAR